MTENQEIDELKTLKREVAKLKLEANLRKSLADQLVVQKKIADEAKEEVEKKSKEVEAISNQLAKYLSPQIHEQIFSEVLSWINGMETRNSKTRTFEIMQKT